MPICGQCHVEHDTVDEVRECYAGARAATRMILGDARVKRAKLVARPATGRSLAWNAVPAALQAVVIHPVRTSHDEPLPYEGKPWLTADELLTRELERLDRQDRSFGAPARWDRSRTQVDEELAALADFGL